MIKFLSSDEVWDYYLLGNKLENNYADVIKFKRKEKKKKKLSTDIQTILKLSASQYDYYNQKYDSYEVIPFMFNDLFRFAYNNKELSSRMLVDYMEVIKLDNTNYIVRDRNGSYQHLIFSKGHIVFGKQLNCQNCTTIGNIIICDNRLYNYKSKTFSYRYDEISLFDVRKIDNAYVECALATIIVKCDFSDVSSSEELTFYINTKGKIITPIETSIGTFSVKNVQELQEVRNKVYASLKKHNFAYRAYLKKKKM